MRRREFLTSAGTGSILAATQANRGIAQMSSSQEWHERAVRFRAEARAAFPFEIVPVNGDAALQSWERMRAEGRGIPVVAGHEDELGLILDSFHPDAYKNRETPDVGRVLEAADQLEHPGGLLMRKAAEHQKYEEQMNADPELREQVQKLLDQIRDSGASVDLSAEAPVGEWPDEPPEPTGLTVARNWKTGRLRFHHPRSDRRLDDDSRLSALGKLE